MYIFFLRIVPKCMYVCEYVCVCVCTAILHICKSNVCGCSFMYVYMEYCQNVRAFSEM